MREFEIGVAVSAYLWFGWEYADEVLRHIDISDKGPRVMYRVFVTIIWPVFVVTQVATHVARW